MGITNKFSTDTNTTKWFPIWDSLKANVAQTQKQIILPCFNSFIRVSADWGHVASKAQNWFQTKKFHDLNFSYHFITSILNSQKLITQTQDFCQYKYSIDPELIGFIKKYKAEPFKEKEKFWGQKLQKFVTLCHLCFSFTCCLISYLEQVLECDWLIYFSVVVSVAWKKILNQN